MTLKRSYEITPLPIGHPIYEILDDLENKVVYEIIVRENKHVAILYCIANADEGIEIDFQELENFEWETLEQATAINMATLVYSRLFSKV